MSGPPPNRSRDETIARLWPTHSTRAIGEAIGLSGQRVAQIARRLYAEGSIAKRPAYWRTVAPRFWPADMGPIPKP